MKGATVRSSADLLIPRIFAPTYSELWSLFERGVDEKTIVLPIYDPLGALA